MKKILLMVNMLLLGSIQGMSEERAARLETTSSIHADCICSYEGCNAKFSDNDALIQHKRAHAKKRPSANFNDADIQVIDDKKPKLQENSVNDPIISMPMMLERIQYQRYGFLDYIEANDSLQALASTNTELKNAIIAYIKYAPNRAALRWKYLKLPKQITVYGKRINAHMDTGCVAYYCKGNTIILDTKRNKAHQFLGDQFSSMDLDPSGTYLFVVLKNATQVQKIDLESRKVVAQWNTEEPLVRIETKIPCNEIWGYTSSGAFNVTYFWHFDGSVVAIENDDSIASTSNNDEFFDELSSDDSSEDESIDESRDASEENNGEHIGLLNEDTSVYSVLSGVLKNRITGEQIKLADSDYYTHYKIGPDETCVMSYRYNEEVSTTIKVYEVISGKLLKEWSCNQCEYVSNIFFSQDSNTIYLLCSDGYYILSFDQEIDLTSKGLESITAKSFWEKVKLYFCRKSMMILDKIDFFGID